MAINPIGNGTNTVYTGGVIPPAPDAPNGDLTPYDSNWISKYTYQPGIGWVLKPAYQNPGLYEGQIKQKDVAPVAVVAPKNKFIRIPVIVAIIVVLYFLFR